jgi:transposase
MALHPTDSTSIPEETRRVARVAFPKGTLAMQLRDTLGSVFADPMFVTLFPRRGQPAEASWRLALVTVLQFVENLSDRQATEAVRGRIDWKYALGLELTDPGFDYSVLCKFRARLLAGQEEGRLLEALLEACKAQGLLKARGRARTDSTHVLAAVRALNRLESITETLRAPLPYPALSHPTIVIPRVEFHASPTLHVLPSPSATITARWRPRCLRPYPLEKHTRCADVRRMTRASRFTL